MKTQVQSILNHFGFDSLNAMQDQSIPFLQENSHALLVAPTGSGKTLTYLLASLPYLKDPKNKDLQTLIIVPTRELCLQIEATVRKMKLGFKVNACYGGHSVDVERKNLRDTPTIVVGTPGRLLDHLHRKNINFSTVHTLVLDEFDKSLEMGFHDDMAELLAAIPAVQRMWFCSATNAAELPYFVDNKRFKLLSFESEVKDRLSYFHVQGNSGKRGRLYDLLNQLPNEASIVFCNQKDTCNALLADMRNKNMDAVAFHGGMDQSKREVALARFRNGSATILVSTDLAARGIDIPELNHVIHYDLPDKEDSFIHRCGRTARVARNGNVYLIPSSEDFPEYVPELEDFKVNNSGQKRPAADWSTLYISGGKKNKINTIDLVGFFLQVGRLEKDELGKIEVKDFTSYVAVKRNRINQVFALCSNQKIKKQKLKIEIARF